MKQLAKRNSAYFFVAESLLLDPRNDSVSLVKRGATGG